MTYDAGTVKPVYKNLDFRLREGSSLKKHLMFKWYMTEDFSLKVLKIVVLIYGFLLYFNLKDIDRPGSSPPLQFHVTASVCPCQFHAPATNTFMLFLGLKISPGHAPATGQSIAPPFYCGQPLTKYGHVK